MRLDLIAVWPFLLVAICLWVIVLGVSLNESSICWFSRCYLQWAPQLDTFSLRQCVPSSNGKLTTVLIYVLVTALIVAFKTGLPGQIPWIPAWLMMAAMPPLFAWLEPPAAHMQHDRQRQIGTYSAWSHYYGYLHLFRGAKNANRPRLEKHIKDNPALEGKLYKDAVVTLWPKDGNNPLSLSGLDGITPRMTKHKDGKEDEDEEKTKIEEVEPVKYKVGGSTRSYGNFKICQVHSSDGNADKEVFVAVDTVGALQTLRNMAQYDPAGLATMDFEEQMHQMLDTMQHIISQRRYLKGQVLLVTYTQDDHIGDRILEEIERVSAA